MNTSAAAADSILKLELYNLFERGARSPRNGFYVARYLTDGAGGWRRAGTVRDFGRDEAAARAFLASAEVGS